MLFTFQVEVNRTVNWLYGYEVRRRINFGRFFLFREVLKKVQAGSESVRVIVTFQSRVFLGLSNRWTS
jgi:hypothetical protein